MWSFGFHGKVPDVRRDVTAHRFNIPDEYASERDAAELSRTVILRALAQCDDRLHIFVGAQGNAGPGDDYSKKFASVDIHVGFVPGKFEWINPGQLSE